MKTRGHLPKPLSQVPAIILTALAMGAVAKSAGLEQSVDDRGKLQADSPIGDPVADHLRCESQTDPVAIDVTRPRLSWNLSSSIRGARQNACQILVASSPAKLVADQGDLWDSGKVAGDQSVHIEYAGKAGTGK